MNRIEQGHYAGTAFEGYGLLMRTLQGLIPNADFRWRVLLSFICVHVVSLQQRPSRVQRNSAFLDWRLMIACRCDAPAYE